MQSLKQKSRLLSIAELSIAGVFCVFGICAIYANKIKNSSKTNNHCIEIVYPADRGDVRNGLPQPSFSPPDYPSYAEYKLTGNLQNDNSELNSSKKALIEISKNNSVQYIHYSISGKTKYSEFIHLLDICQEEKIRYYCNYGYDFWIWNDGDQRKNL